MTTRTDTLTIYQAASFRQSFTCSLDDVGIPDIEAWAASAPWASRSTFHLSFLDDDHPRYELLSASYVYLDGNTVTLYITKEGADRLRELSGRGRYTVNVTNGTTTHTVMAGTWDLQRTSWQQSELQTVWEDFDGIVLDCDAKYDATASPEDKRLYVAHGRKVSAVRISDATQMIAEDMYFSSVGTAVKEKPNAVRIDSTSDLLYILTNEGGLYCKDISDQTSPVDAYAMLDLTGYLALGETPNDVAVWSGVGEEVVVVLTSRKIITIKDVAGVLTVVGQTSSISAGSPLTDANPVAANSVNSLLVSDWVRMVVGKDGDGRVVAYVTASARGYELATATRPFSRVLVLCDLDLSGGYVAPTFTFAGAPYCVFYNPFPVAPSAWITFVAAGGLAPDGTQAIKKEHYYVFDVERFDAGATDWLFVSHGRRNQVRKLNVTNALTTGIVVGAAIACHPLFATDPYSAQDIAHVHVDPTDIDHLVIIEEDNDGPRVIDGNPPTSITLLDNTRYGAGCPRKDAVIAISGKHFTVWTFDIQAVSHTFRVIDGSTNTPTALYNKWWFMNSDGMVAYPPNTIYQLSFGGIVPYHRSLENGGWEPDSAGYSPAYVDSPFSPGTLAGSNTETIDIGHNVSGAGDSRLFTVSASLGFMEYKINASTLRPGAARLFLVPPSTPHDSFPGWTTPEDIGTYYSNDIVYTTIDGVPYILFDITNRPLSKWALAAYRYNSESDSWDFRNVVIVDTDYVAYDIPFCDAIYLSEGLPHRFAFVQTVASVFSVRIDLLESKNEMFLCDLMYTTDITVSEPTAGSNGLVLCGSRMIINLSPIGGDSGLAQLRVYDFDARNGNIVQDDPVQVLESTSVTLPSGHSGWRNSFKMRAHLKNDRGAAAVYLGNTGGNVLEFEYEPANLIPLTFKSSWQSDYTNVIADVREYDFGDGPQVLVSKNTEGFAILNPSAFRRNP